VQVVFDTVPRTRSFGQKITTAGDLARSRGTLGAFSLERADDGAFLVFFTEPGGNSTLVRRLPPNAQGARVAVEEAAIVVRSLVQALLEGHRIGMTSEAAAADERELLPEARPPDETPAEEAAAPAGQRESAEGPSAPDEADRVAAHDWPSPSRTRTVAATAAYAGTDFAPDASWQSGFTLGFRWLALSPFYAAARYTFFPELEGGTTETAVSIARHPAEVVAGYVGATRVAANAELGITVDYVTRRTRSNTAGYEPTPAKARAMVALGARAGVTWAMMPALELGARGGADLLVTSYEYVMPEGDAVLSPHRVRPRLDVELALGLW
jgi:hypothetical protein